MKKDNFIFVCNILAEEVHSISSETQTDRASAKKKVFNVLSNHIDIILDNINIQSNKKGDNAND